MDGQGCRDDACGTHGEGGRCWGFTKLRKAHARPALSATLCFRFCTFGHIMVPTGGREGSWRGSSLRGISYSRPRYGSNPGQIMG